ncbi:MAG: hypothetical protein HYY06_11670 [Deltaproteobacteria bacterium]|nr:hypothetical protein [Deltaproteobacteria bacterium]
MERIVKKAPPRGILPPLRLPQHLAPLLFVACGCQADAVVDVTIVSADGRPIADAEATVCDALDRTAVLGRTSISSGDTAGLSFAADGSAVGIAVFAEPDLCGASCQQVLESGASIEGEMVLWTCASCRGRQPSADEVCLDPLCFVDGSRLSLCPE